MTPDDYILWSVKNGGWLSKGAFTHSDYREATVFTLDDALSLAKLHEGRLLPVNKMIYAQVLTK